MPLMLTKEELEPLLEAGMSKNQIRIHLGCSMTKVVYACDKYGLKSNWESRQEKNKALKENQQKQCAACSEIKAYSEFNPDKRASDGLNSQCKVCKDRTTRIWQSKNPDNVRRAVKKWRENNRDYWKEYSPKYWAKNKEARKAHLKEWYKRNPEMMSHYRLLRAERERGAPGTCTPEQLKARIEMYGEKCWNPYCDRDYNAIDHVKPLGKGGSNWPSNLRPICTSCNSRKKDNWPYSFK